MHNQWVNICLFQYKVNINRLPLETIPKTAIDFTTTNKKKLE